MSPATETTAIDTGVKLAGLRKSCGATVAVDGIDLDVAPGEVVALLGPNGAGEVHHHRHVARPHPSGRRHGAVVGPIPQSHSRTVRSPPALASIPVDLRDTSTGLDQTNLDLVAAAVLHAGGHHPTPERQDTP